MATRHHTRSRRSSPSANHKAEPKPDRRSAESLHPTRNDLSAETRHAIVALCNARLADLLDLYSQVKQAHWNVKGPGFHAVHEFLDEVAGVINGYADEVAERAVQLGGTALGTVRMAAAASTLAEYPERLTAQQRTLQTVADRLASVGTSVRDAIDHADELEDADTADLFTGLSRAIDKHLWFVESHLYPG